MYAGDWMYLCACHGEEKQCCAIDYMIHTLDGTSALLNSARHFPSRTFIPNTSLRHFGSVARRLSRIFVHAWGHHRECFESCEAETSLYARFYTLAERYDLVQLEDLPPINSTSSTSSTSETNSRIPDSSAFSPREPNSNSQAFSTTSSSTSDQPIVARILKRGSDELPDQSTTSLDRNDSNASRLTAIRIGKEKKKIEGEGIEETLEEGFKKLDLEKEESGEEEIPKSLDSLEMVGNERRELSADEAPTEVKDEEDVEDQDEEQGGELETESQVQRQESTQNQEGLSEPVESESSKVENQDRKQVEPQESSLLFLSPSI